jgi:hypothetical protein
MAKKENIQKRRLASLESEFRSLLPTVLRQCAGGRWGLFGQNDHPDGSKYLFWSEAEQLKGIAGEIQSIRLEFGESNPQVERFLHYCSLRGSNVPGEPKLAKLFLDELERGLAVDTRLQMSVIACYRQFTPQKQNRRLHELFRALK